MGPRLFSKKKGETIYSIRAIPFGGFVSMSGEELEEEIVKIGDKIRLDFDEENIVKRIIINPKNDKYQDLLEVTVETMDLSGEDSLFINEYQVKQDAFYVFDKNEMQIAPNNRRFDSKTKTQRFLTTFGGPLMNFVLALVIYLIIAFAIGVPNTASTVVSEVSENSPAYEVIEPGDKIISINGVEVDSWSDEGDSITSQLASINSDYSQGYDIVVERNGQLITLEKIYPQLLFFGLGFAGSSGSDGLIIDSPLYIKSELLPGDEILTLNGLEMNSWNEVLAFAYINSEGSTDEEDLFSITVFRQAISEYEGVVVDIRVEGDYTLVEIDPTDLDDNIVYRVGDKETVLVQKDDAVVIDSAISDGAVYEFEYIVYGEDVLNAMNTTYFTSRIGISGESKFSIFGAIGNAFIMLWGAATSIFGTLGLLFTSSLVGVSDLSGFVGIFSMTSEAASAGVISLLSFIGLLSVNLGILNLLPIPALDGGRIVFIGYEAITKKKPNKKVENWLHTIVFFLLIALMIYVTYNDILRLIGI
jgi:regulator of sigma E protease